MSLPPVWNLIAVLVDMLAMSLVIGACIWFFFIQSPVLYSVSERERFVPIQMRLARLALNTATISLGVLVVSAILWAGWNWPAITAVFSLAMAGINRFIVLPIALKAGGRSRRNREGQGEAGTGLGFAVEGAGPSATAMHLTVVLFVVLMVAGLAAHTFTIAVALPFK